MFFHSSNQPNLLIDQNVALNGTKLEVVEKFVYLGIRLDSQLSFNGHVEHLYQGAVNMVFTLKNIRPYMDMNTSLMIFKAHILSRLEYGSLFCTGSNMSKLRRLQVLVNKSLRICLCLPRDSNVFKMHVEARILPLSIRRNITLLKLMYGISVKMNVDKHDTGIITRSKKSATVPCHFPRTEAFKRSVAYQGPARWAKIPHEIKNVVSLDHFKDAVKEYFWGVFLEEQIV